MAETLQFTCRVCDEVHEGWPDWGCDAPDYYWSIPDGERHQRCELDSDLCIVDNEHFFIRGVLVVPIVGADQPFGWGVWTTLSERNFHRYVDLWGAEDVSGESPYFGWFSNRLPFYPDTRNLKLEVILQADGLRPVLELEPTDHPLAVDQRDGVAWDQAITMAQRLLHGDLEYPDS